MIASKQPPTTSTRTLSTTTSTTASTAVVSSPAVNGISDPSQENNRRSSIPLPISSVVSAISSTVKPKPNNNALSQQTVPISQGKLLRNKVFQALEDLTGYFYACAHIYYTKYAFRILFSDTKANNDASNKTAGNGVQQYSALISPKITTNNINKQKQNTGMAGPRGRMLPAVPSPSPSPFKPIQSPVRQAGNNHTSSSPSTYHPNNIKISREHAKHTNLAETLNNESDVMYSNEGNHNYVNIPNNVSQIQQRQLPATAIAPSALYANIPASATGSANIYSRPNSTTSFAEIQQAKQKQQQLEQQRRRESTGSGKFVVETSSRLVSNAMNGMLQNPNDNLSDPSQTQRHKSSSQASLTSSSATAGT